MITRKDLIIALLLTFCLSVTLFRIMPISSQPAGNYDPWADINDDGKIDIRDVSVVAKQFGTYGDPVNKTALLYNVSDMFTELLTEIHVLNATVQEHKSDITVLMTQVGHLEAEINYVNATLRHQIENLEANISELEMKVAILNATVAEHGHNITELKSRLEPLGGFEVNSTHGIFSDYTSEIYNWVDMDDMSVTISLQKTSHIVILFSTEAEIIQGHGNIMIRATIDGNNTNPSYGVYLTPFVSKEGGLPGHRHSLRDGSYSYNFYQSSVPAGNYTVKIQWRLDEEETGVQGEVGDRTLTVLAFPIE